MRPINEKNLCMYCDGDTATFGGYWKLISVDNYSDPKGKYQKIIDTCYAHIGCYIEKHKKILLTGVVPLTTHSEVTNSPKKIVQLMKIHCVSKRRLKSNITFLNKVLEVYDSVKKYD